MKKTILSFMLLAVCVTTVFTYSEAVHEFFNLYYSDANTDMEKTFSILERAEENAKEQWEKHLIYIWLSQVYMQLEDDMNYEKYIALAENVFSSGIFFNKVKNLNDDENKSLFDTD